MKRMTLGMAAMLLTGSVGIAYATPNLVQNGDFSNASPVQNEPTQFGGSVRTGYDANGPGCTFGGDFISGWSGNGGYELWYPSAAAASGTTSCNQYNANISQRLPAAVTAPPVGTGTFVGLDGQRGINGGISQTVGGLTAGDRYTVSFYWGTTQEMSRNEATWDYLRVSLGSDTHTTVTNNIEEHGWSGWAPVSFSFTANSASEVLNFLSFGGQKGKTFEASAGVPPFAVLTAVSLTHNVPEPPELALFGSGLLGLGLLTIFARRRALRRSGPGGDGDIS